jgi:hypothetical protein
MHRGVVEGIGFLNPLSFSHRPTSLYYYTYTEHWVSGRRWPIISACGKYWSFKGEHFICTQAVGDIVGIQKNQNKICRR